VAHRAQVVDFIRLHFLQDTGQVGGIGQVAVVQVEFRVRRVRILIDMVHTLGVERRGTTFNTVYFITFFQQQFCQVRTILPGNAGDESDFRHVYFSLLMKFFSFNAFAYHHCGLPRQTLFAGSDLKTLLRAPNRAIANRNTRCNKNIRCQPAFFANHNRRSGNIKMLTHKIVTAGAQITFL
jgi:hypothetical protein